MSKRDYYEILGLAKTSTEDEIKQAYRRLAMKFHPDRNQGDGAKEAEEKFKEVKEAYEHLSDPARRAEYDHRSAGPTFHGFRSHENYTRDDLDEYIRSQFNFNHSGFEGFGDLFGTRRQQQPKQNIYVLTISLADAYVGKTVTLTNNVQLTIPRGVRSGAKIFGHDGKLYKIDVQQHFKFKRADDDLLVDVNISAIQAMLGVEATLDHLDGSKLQFAIPAGIQPGQIVRLGKKGMKNPENDKTGDLLVRIGVVIPRNLTAENIATLKMLGPENTITI